MFTKFLRPWRKVAIAAIVSAAGIATVSTAMAGECPADKIVADRKGQPMGATDTVLAAIDLSNENVKADDHQFRVRQLVIQPGGSELAARLHKDMAKDPMVAELASYGCGTTMHLVRLLAPRLDLDDHTKDIDFSAEGISARWEAGYDYARRAINRQPWDCEVDALSGVLIHDVNDGTTVTEHA